jgi:hypothetical protein
VSTTSFDADAFHARGFATITGALDRNAVAHGSSAASTRSDSSGVISGPRPRGRRRALRWPRPAAPGRIASGAQSARIVSGFPRFSVDSRGGVR